MRKYTFYLSLSLLLVANSSCEYFEAQTTSEGTTKQIVSSVLVQLLGDQIVILQQDDEFDDPGVIAYFGPEIVTEDVEISSELETSVPGIYLIVYTITKINEIGEEISASATRYVNVLSDEDVGINLSGSFLGVGFSNSPTPAAVNAISAGWYEISDILGSSNGIQAQFLVNGATKEVLIPDQSSPFGNLNTLVPGTFGVLGDDKDSWEWVVFIGCCGNFGPVSWTRQ